MHGVWFIFTTYTSNQRSSGTCLFDGSTYAFLDLIHFKSIYVSAVPSINSILNDGFVYIPSIAISMLSLAPIRKLGLPWHAPLSSNNLKVLVDPSNPSTHTSSLECPLLLSTAVPHPPPLEQLHLQSTSTR